MDAAMEAHIEQQSRLQAAPEASESLSVTVVPPSAKSSTLPPPAPPPPPQKPKGPRQAPAAAKPLNEDLKGFMGGLASGRKKSVAPSAQQQTEDVMQNWDIVSYARELNLTSANVREVASMFFNFDDDGDGSLDYNEFEKAVLRL